MVTPTTMLRKWKEFFPNVSGVGKLTIPWKNVFAGKHNVMDTRSLARHIVIKCPEKRAPRKPKAKRESKKKEKKPVGIHSVEEMETMAEPVDKTAWPMLP